MADIVATREGAVNRGFARVSWGAIFAGAVTTIALGILLLSLGAAVGATAFDPGRGQFGFGSTTGGVVASIWALLSIVIATFLGAWVASRASAVDAKSEAGLQGLFVWALSFVAMLAWTASTATRNLAALEIQGATAAAAPGGEFGAAAAWWFFLSAALAALAGILGGTAGLPKSLRQGMEVRRRPLTPTETRA